MRTTYPKKAISAFLIYEIVSTIVGVVIYMVAPFGHVLRPQLNLSDIIFFFITYSFCLSVPTALIINRLGKLSFLSSIIISIFSCIFVIGVFVYGRGVETFTIAGFIQLFSRYIFIFIPMAAVSWVLWDVLAGKNSFLDK